MTREELLAKIEAATGPNFQLECDIAVELEPRRIAAHPIPPNYTASIDAALGLVERLLGVDDQELCFSYELGWHCYAHAAMAYIADLHLASDYPGNIRTVNAQANTQPLAILAALLRALPPSHEAAR